MKRKPQRRETIAQLRAEVSRLRQVLAVLVMRDGGSVYVQVGEVEEIAACSLKEEYSNEGARLSLVHTRTGSSIKPLIIRPKLTAH